MLEYMKFMIGGYIGWETIEMIRTPKVCPTASTAPNWKPCSMTTE